MAPCWGSAYGGSTDVQERTLRKVLLIQAIEETDRDGAALPLEERAQATRTVMGDKPPVAETQAGAPLSSATEWLLERRAELLLEKLRARSPGVDHVLDLAGRATALTRSTLIAAFAGGMLLSLLDGARGINIFALPLVLLIAWNVLVYLVMLARANRRVTSTAGATAAATGATARPAFWFARLYARSVRRRIDHLLDHSTHFNAPLTPGLRRFANDWWDIAQPLFAARARRLLHLGAIGVALGLVAAYCLRAFIFRSAAGWEGGGAIGPDTAHILLTLLYGPAALLSGTPIPSAHDIAYLRWTAPSLAGVGEPASWVYLIACTAAIYVVVPRLIAVVVATLRVWRVSRQVDVPPGVSGYVQTLLARAKS